MAIKFGKGRAEVSITGPTAQDIEAELRDTLGPLLSAIEDKVEPILEEAKKNWPVRSGESRDSLGLALQIDPGTFKVNVAITSDVFYTRLIKNSTRVGKAGDKVRPRKPVTTHLRKPTTQANRELKRELVVLLSELIQNGLFD